MKLHEFEGLRSHAKLFKTSLVLLPIFLTLAQACGTPATSSKRNLSQNSSELKIPAKGQNLIRSESQENQFLEPVGLVKTKSETGTISLSGVKDSDGADARVALD